LPWSAKPDKAAQLSAYMSLSRVSHIDDTYITQPYSPLLFSQGDLPGPELLLKFQRGDLDVDDLEAAWKARRETKTRRRE
jgi:hypothetical protein